MTAVVVDASALVEYLFRTPLGTQVATIVEAPDTDLHVPALCDVEVTRALARSVEEKIVGLPRAGEALEAYRDLPLVRYGHGWLLDRALELHARFDADDAIYVALCERLDATLVTGDERLTKDVQRHLTLNVFGVTG